MTFFRRFYTIDSDQRLSGSHHNFTFRVDIPSLTTIDLKQLHVAMTAASIPKSYYLVSGTRNTFTLTENGTDITITVPAGNYNVNTFRTTVTALMNAATLNANVYSFTFSDTTCKYTVSVVGAAAASVTMPDANGSGIHDQFGLNKNTTTAIPFTSTNCVSFSTMAAVQIRSDIGRDSVGVLQNIFAAETPVYSTITYYASDLDIRAHPLATKDSNVFNFKLTDTDGNLVDTNGRPLVFTLVIYTPLEMTIRDYIFLKTMMVKLDIASRESSAPVVAPPLTLPPSATDEKTPAAAEPQAVPAAN